MTNWYSGIYKSLIIASVISFIIYYFSSGDVSLGALISGYSVLTMSILMILYIILFNLLQVTQNKGFFQSLLTMITACGPFLLMLFVIGFVLYLVIKYKNRILSGHVYTGYNTFTNITILMILLQVYLVYNNINSDKFESTYRLSKITTSLLYLYGVISVISSITLFTILNNFSADGFHLLKKVEPKQ